VFIRRDPEEVERVDQSPMISTAWPSGWEAPSPRAWRRVLPRATMAEELGEALDVMRELKRALDPKGNDPGKVFPESRDT